MQNGLVYILQSLIDLYLLAYVLRLGMNWVRSDPRNPIVQFVLTVTNPLVLPLRRFIPPIYKADTATLIVFVLLQWTKIGLLASLACQIAPDLTVTLGLALIASLRLVLSVYTGIIFAYVLLSWIGQGASNPMLSILSQLVSRLAEPVMAPLRRYIPPIAGWDLSPIFLLIGLQALAQTLISPAYKIAGPFVCNIMTLI
jgi:YggT family protein